MLKIPLIALALMLPSPIEAATRWVVASGGLGSGTCTTTGTACTIARALAVAVAGDEVVFRRTGGNYTNLPAIVITTGGTSDTNRITFRSENLHEAVLEPASGVRAFHIKAKWITIRGFRVDGRGRNQACFFIYSSDSGPIVEGLIVEQNQCVNQGGVAFHGYRMNNVKLRFNEINKTGQDGTGGSCCSEAFYIGNTDGSAARAATNVEIYGNIVKNAISNVFDIKATASGVNIHHNIVDSWHWPLASEEDNDSGSGVLVAGGHSTGNVFRSNIFRNGTGASLYAILRTQDKNWSVNNNVIYNFQGKRAMSIKDASGSNQDWTNNTWCNTPTSIEKDPASTVANTSGNQFGQTQSVCDAEVARILAEMANLPGNPGTVLPPSALTAPTALEVK